MFYKHKAFDKINHNIYVYNNFLSNQEIDTITSFLKENNKSLWTDKNENTKRISIGIDNIGYIYQRIEGILKFFMPGYFANTSNTFLKFSKGDQWELHSDDHDYLDTLKKSKKYKEGSKYTIEKVPEWGIYLFLGKCKGGEIFFEKYKLDFIPKPGDLLIYSTKLKHEMKPILSGVRYIHTNAIFREIRVPIS
jgi:hypothetical protein